VAISTDGANEPVWSRDGKELFFRNGASMLSVPYTVSESEFVPGKPSVLFQKNFFFTTPMGMYDVARDGRFLMVQPIPEEAAARDKSIFPSTLRIVLNWTSELKR
jgi:hypothetical protein